MGGRLQFIRVQIRTEWFHFFFHSESVEAEEDTSLGSLKMNLISFRFGHFGPGPTETDITVLSFGLANRGRTLLNCDRWGVVQ
jgi:hypothetical protein